MVKANDIKCYVTTGIDVVQQWNTCRTAYSAVNRSMHPRRVPDKLIYFPAPPAVDCLYRNMGQLTHDILQSVRQPGIYADADFGNYLMYLCQQHGWQPP